MKTIKETALWIIKLGGIGLLVFYFVQADISVQLVLTYLLYMFVERSSQISKLEDKVETQIEIIAELESKIDRISKK